MLQQPNTEKKKGSINKVLISIFTVSILVQIIVPTAISAVVAIIATALNTDFLIGIFFFPIHITSSISISWLTSFLTVRLYLQKNLSSYGGEDITKNAIISAIITSLIIPVGTTIAAMAGKIDSFVGGWILIFSFLFAFGMLFFSFIIATLFCFWTTKYLNVAKAKQAAAVPLQNN